MSKKIDGFMPLRIQKYMFDTMDLTTEEHGAYLLLLMAYWSNGGPLDYDEERLRTVTKTSKFIFKKVWLKIGKFFEVKDGKIYQKRADEELEKARFITEKRSAAGEIGAKSRWQKDGNRTARPMANHMANDIANRCTSTSTEEDSLSTTLPLVNNLQTKTPVQPLSASSEKSDAGPSGPLDVKKLVWQTGVQYLTRNGVSEAQARTVIGKWRKHYRDADILNAMAASDTEVAANPIAFIQKVLNRSETNDRRAEQFKPSDVFRRTYAATDDAD